MELNAQELKDGRNWFFGSLLVAIAFCVFLSRVDDKLTYSKGEKILGDTLRELRTAQTSLPSGVSDPRQTALFVEIPAVTEESSGHDHH